MLTILSREPDTGPRRQGHQGMALLELNPHYECLRWGLLYWLPPGGPGFTWMNLYELKQPLQSKEPTHFITAPAHRALTVPHALWIMEEKKKSFNFLGHRIQVGSRLYKELTHWGNKACKQEQVLFTLSCEPVLETGRKAWVALLESTLVYVPGFYELCPTPMSTLAWEGEEDLWVSMALVISPEPFLFFPIKISQQAQQQA